MAKDYTQRHNAQKFYPWWLNKIAEGKYTVATAIDTLNTGKIKCVNRKDILGIIQLLEQNNELGNIPAQRGLGIQSKLGI